PTQPGDPVLVVLNPRGLGVQFEALVKASLRKTNALARAPEQIARLGVSITALTLPRGLDQQILYAGKSVRVILPVRTRLRVPVACVVNKASRIDSPFGVETESLRREAQVFVGIACNQPRLDQTLSRLPNFAVGVSNGSCAGRVRLPSRYKTRPAPDSAASAP